MFISRIPAEAKIVVVILFAIIVPTILLSMFSVRAIVAERSDIEKTIELRGEMLSRQVAERSVYPFFDASNRLKNICSSTDAEQLPDEVEKLAKEYPFVDYPFVIGEDGTF
ncbi:MAG: hypothetical protein ABIH42_01660, partial [Planctomycetota bacterium]